MATGVLGGIGGTGAGCSGGGGAGFGCGVGGCGALSAGCDVGLCAKLCARLGAIIAFSTFVEPQTGQLTSARLACLS